MWTASLALAIEGFALDACSSNNAIFQRGLKGRPPQRWDRFAPFDSPLGGDVANYNNHLYKEGYEDDNHKGRYQEVWHHVEDSILHGIHISTGAIVNVLLRQTLRSSIAGIALANLLRLPHSGKHAFEVSCIDALPSSCRFFVFKIASSLSFEVFKYFSQIHILRIGTTIVITFACTATFLHVLDGTLVVKKKRGRFSCIDRCVP